MASARYGRREPTGLVLPAGAVSSDGAVATEFLKHGGVELLPWQADRMDEWLAKDYRGRWAARSAGMEVSRQNGKTCVVAGRCDFGMAAYGEWIIYTAHLQKTATETFEEMANFFETGEMTAYVKDIKTALGREEIRLQDPRTHEPLGRIKFLARTRNGGRGQHGDLLIFDEAQELTDAQQASFLPCLAASKNPQTMYLGTPPDEESPGEVFNRIRNDALGGKSQYIAWAEWGLDKYEPDKRDDRDLWAMTNPSLGYLIQEDTIETEYEQMAPDKFMRERLGWWQDYSVNASVIPADQWELCATDEPATDGITTFAAKFEPGGNVGTICFCTKSTEGKPHIEFVESEPIADGLQWMVDFLVKVAPQAAQIVVDGGGYADTLLERLRASGVNKRVLIKPRAADMVTACAQLLTAVNEGSITHLDEDNLNAAALKTTRRNIGKEGWGFASTEDGDASIIEAAALAYWAALKTKRDPSRKGRIG